MSITLHGIGASPGIAIAPAHWFRPAAALSNAAAGCGDAELEWEKFKKATVDARSDLEALRDRTAAELGPAKAEIFDAHLSILKDPELAAEVRRLIYETGASAALAVRGAEALFVDLLSQVEDELFAGRIQDVRDIADRLVRTLEGRGGQDIALSSEAVVLASDLTPSQTAQLDRSLTCGFVTEGGSAVSHSAILARSIGIPAVVGIGPMPKIEDGTLVAVDGSEGIVVLDPDTGELERYRLKQAEHLERLATLREFADRPSLSADGVRFELAANIGGPADLEGAERNGAEGIGLFRTEFMFMDRSAMPTEDEQFEVYRYVLSRMAGRPVVIRTLDVGGDKEISYIPLAKEANPFLGVRAIRLCLADETLFRTQLRALLRSSIYGKLRILLPMVAVLEELRRAKVILAEERAALESLGVPVASYELGVMIEIPSAALLATSLAEEVDFFSVGSNDLTQYAMAADRMNPTVAYLHRGLQPAVLRLIAMAAEAALARGKWIGICGELAADPAAVPLFVGMGITELSMGASAIPSVRASLSRIDTSQARALSKRAAALDSAEEIRELAQGVLG